MSIGNILNSKLKFTIVDIYIYIHRYTAPTEQNIIKKWSEDSFSTLKKYYHFLAIQKLHVGSV